jgi:hypothetical protein
VPDCAPDGWNPPRPCLDPLWLLNSGTGEFGWIDTATGRFTPVAFCPGYARGLAFAGRYAIVGLSRPRDNKTFQGLPLDDALQRHDAEARCGLLVIDLDSGDAVEWVRIEGVVDELFDVAVLPGVRMPSAIGIRSTEIRRVISVEGSGLLAASILERLLGLEHSAAGDCRYTDPGTLWRRYRSPSQPRERPRTSLEGSDRRPPVPRCGCSDSPRPRT